jgi:DNA-binding beta-propeller fold protein YncE
MERWGLLGTVLLVLALVGAAAADAATPAQLPGTSGCVSQRGEGGCARGRAIAEPEAPLAISRDGRSAYLVADSNPEGIEADAVDVFDRDPATGALTQKPGAEGCLAASGRDGCAKLTQLFDAHQAVVSPDGRNVYVAGEPGVVAFARDPTTGALTPLGGAAECIGGTGVRAPCQRGRGLAGADSLAFSPDGAELYVTSNAHPTVAVLRRDPVTGAISEAAGAAGCVVSAPGPRRCGAKGAAQGSAYGIVASGDGRGVYVLVGTETTEGVEISRVDSFARNASGALRRRGGRAGCLHPTGKAGCPAGRGLHVIEGLALSPDGGSLYVTSTFSSDAGAISIFRRSPGGALSQPAGKAACLSANGGECTVDKALSGAGGVTVSPDGTAVYVTSLWGLAVLDRSESGELTAPAAAASCLSDFHHACTAARGLEATSGVTVSPDGANLYATSSEPGGVAIFRR